MSGNENSSDYRLDREDYPYFTEDEFKTFSVEGRDFAKKMHLKYKKRYETRIAKYSLDHDIGRNLEMDLNIVICGKTGSGMSSTANTILGRKEFRATRSSNSVTKVSLDNTCTYRGRRITVVDTPGINATDVDNATVKKELARIAYLLKDGVHCFIICMSAGETRFTEEVNEMLKLIKQDGRENVYDYCMLTYTKAETEMELCTLGEFLEKKKQSENNRRFLENINNRVVAVNNKCSVPAEALRNRDALIKMVDAVVTENIQNGKPVWAGEIFEKASKLQEKLTSLVQDESFHPEMVNATIKVKINNTSSRLTFDIFFKEVRSILTERENSEKLNTIPDLIIPGTDRVHDKYLKQIQQIYHKIQPELNMFWWNVGYFILVAAPIVAAIVATRFSKNCYFQ